MKSDFILAITQLSAEKNLPKEVVLGAIESALVSAYRKDSFGPTQNISVTINPANGSVTVWAEKTVVEKPEDNRQEISLAEAQNLNKDIQLGDPIMVEATPSNAGRVAAQTAKQVILQRLHEAEHSAIFEEYADKEGDVVTGMVQRIEFGHVFVDLGRTEALLPAAEQARMERYRIGQRLKVLILQVSHTPRGARVVVSRTHPDLLRRLFELEVPEIFNGVVEIKAIAREAGNRSKVAVTTSQQGIDPVGCCVGLRGIRIQNIVNELNGEKIDVVLWDADPKIFVAHALSPTRIVSVELNKEDEIATVVVPDKQLSLAIGREGQNARLAAKLAGWRIDIKSAAAAEAEKLAATAAEPAAEVPAEPAPEEATPAAVSGEEIPVAIPEPEPVPVPDQPAPVSEKAAEVKLPEPVFFNPPVAGGKSQIRFAEDINVPRPDRSIPKVKKKKKKKTTSAKESAEDGIRIKKKHRGTTVPGGDDEEF